MIWWPYILTACLIELAVHAYLSRTVPNEPKLDKHRKRDGKTAKKSKNFDFEK